MQGQSSSVESLPETLEFDHRSSSSAVGMDHDVYWSSMLLHQEETQNLPNFFLSPSDTNMSYINMSTEDSPSLSIWSSGGPSSAEHPIDQRNHDETKMELGWPASSLDGGAIEADNMLSPEDADINLNSTQIDDDQSFSFPLSSNLNDIPHDIEPNASHVGDGVSGSGLFPHPYMPSLMEHELGQSSSNLPGNSSAINGLMSGDYDDRPGSSLDSRRLACKRKNIEGLPGQSSTSGSTNFFHTGESNLAHSTSVRTNSTTAGMNISSPSIYTPGASSSREQLNPRLSTISRGPPPNDYSPACVTRNVESSRRNFRVRINPARQHDVYPPHLSISRNAIHNSSIWLPNEPSSNLIAFDRRLESRPVAAGSSSQNQPNIPINPAPPRHVNLHPWNGAPNSRNGSSPSSLNSLELLTAIREDSMSRTPRNDMPVQSLLVPATEISNLDAANGSASMAGSMGPTSSAGTSSGGHSSAGSSWIPHQEDQLSRGMAEIVHRRFLASVDSESRAHIRNFLLQRTSQSSTSQEVGHQSGRVSRGNQQSQAALVLDRQTDGVPLSSRSLLAREGRSRMILEIRNALDLMHRGERLRFEDVFMLDHPLFHGVADLHDRHRDMRLDVDNMSYEELLALEERIGNVSTGLSEEIIFKNLKQRKHFPIGGGATVETEPCCICQEEYVEADDLGTLDCGHDFHTSCIKQWLMQKNLCPVCKMTALNIS